MIRGAWGDLGTWGLGDMGTWGHGDMGTWGLGDLGTEIPGEYINMINISDLLVSKSPCTPATYTRS